MQKVLSNFTARLIISVCAVSLCFQTHIAFAQNTSNITVQVDKPGAEISPTMFGIFFEDINFGADGGLYPERVKNRSFEFPEPMMAWKQIDKGGAQGTLSVLTQDPINDENAHYAHFEVTTAGKGFGISNEGFRAMGFQRGATYV